MNKKFKTLIMVTIAIALAIAGWFVLPDKVVIQIGLDGKPTRVVSKIIAILIPLVISFFGAIQYYSEEEKSEIKGKLLIVFVGYLVAIISLIIN